MGHVKPIAPQFAEDQQDWPYPDVDESPYDDDDEDDDDPIDDDDEFDDAPGLLAWLRG